MKLKSILILITLGVVCILFFQNTSVTYTQKSYGFDVSNTMHPLGPLVQGTIVEQQFNSTLENFNQVSLFMATYARSNYSNLEFILFRKRAQDWEEVFRKTYDVSGWKDNAYFTFEVPKQEAALGVDFKLVMITDAKENNAITAWTVEKDVPDKQVKLSLNERTIKGYIPFYLTFQEQKKLNISEVVQNTKGALSDTLNTIKIVSFCMFIVLIFVILFILLKSLNREE